MGFSGDLGLDSDSLIRLRVAPLKRMYTNSEKDDEEEECGGGGSTTPTSVEARIPTRLTCPPPPRKRKSKPASKCNYVRDFFTPPDHLENVFISRHVERAN